MDPLGSCKCNAWLSTGHPKSLTMCLRTLSKHTLNSGWLRVVAKGRISFADKENSQILFSPAFYFMWWFFHLYKAHISFLGRNNSSILHPFIIAAVFMRGQHRWETKSRIPVTSMEHKFPSFSYAVVWNLPIPNACDFWQHCLISEPSLSVKTCIVIFSFLFIFPSGELFKCNGCRAGFPSSALVTFASLCLIHRVSQSKDKPWAEWAPPAFAGTSTTVDSPQGVLMAQVKGALCNPTKCLISVPLILEVKPNGQTQNKQTKIISDKSMGCIGLSFSQSIWKVTAEGCGDPEDSLAPTVSCWASPSDSILYGKGAQITCLQKIRTFLAWSVNQTK